MLLILFSYLKVYLDVPKLLRFAQLFIISIAPKNPSNLRYVYARFSDMGFSK